MLMDNAWISSRDPGWIAKPVRVLSLAARGEAPPRGDHMMPKTPEDMPAMDAPAQAKPEPEGSSRNAPSEDLKTAEGGTINPPSGPKDMTQDD